jgi:phage terminase large subunit-like protein
VSGSDRTRQQRLRDFLDLCHRVGFTPEPFQVKIASALLGSEREKLIMLPRKNGKSRLVGTFAAWHLLTTPKAQAYVAANSEEQARIVFEYARDVALHPAVDEQFTVRYRELRRPDGGYLRVRAADAGKLLGLSPSLAVLDEYCEAKDDSVYTALRTALLPGAMMFTITTAGMGAESPLGRLRARALGQADVRVRGALTDARGEGIRLLEWGVDPDTTLENYAAAKKANPLSMITTKWLREQREAVHELHYRRFHLNQWTSRIGSWLPAGAWQACANGATSIPEGSRIFVGVDVGGARADTAIVWLDESFHVGVQIFSGDDALTDAAIFVPELAARYQVQEIVYDNWRAAMLAKAWESRGLRCTVFAQSDNRMIPASAALHQAIVEKKIHHPNDPKLNEHVAAAVAKHGRRGWRIDQAERGTNIDGLVALVMAYEAATAPQPAPTRVIGWL